MLRNTLFRNVAKEEEEIKNLMEPFNETNFNRLIKTYSINWRNGKNWTLLHVSAYFNYVDAAKALIAKYPDLLNTPNRYHQYPIHLAISNGNCEFLLHTLLEKGANPDVLAKYDYEDSTIAPHLSPLHWSVMLNHPACVKVLLDYNASITLENENKMTALDLAAFKNNPEIVKILLNKSPDLVNTPGRYHQYPIHIASSNGNCDIVSLLLEHGADVNALAKIDGDISPTNPSFSALHLAAFKNSTDCVKVLLNHNANVNLQESKYGFTALHVAVSRNNYEMVKLLVEAGADTSLKENNGLTVIKLAGYTGNQQIIDYLKKH